MPIIKDIIAREILSSSGIPTIQVKCILESGIIGESSVAFGASTGRYEAYTLIDKGKRYNGNGMLKAVSNVNNIISKKLIGLESSNQKMIDELMIKLDGTKNKKKLGANAILGVSMAVAKAASLEKKIPLYMYLREIYNLKLKNYSLPKPMMVVIEGGKHAINSIDFQEYLISPYKYNSVKENIRCGIEIYLKLKDLLLKKGYSCNIGNEGGFALNNLNSNEDPLKLINDAIIKSGYNPMKDVGISLDIASSEFYKNKKYFLKKENIVLNSFDLINYYEKIIKKYPIVSIEDGLSQDDWENWIKLNQKFKDQILVIGDDLTVTNKKLLEKAISLNAINSIIIKLNQIGTLTETIECFLLARKNNISTIMSHRGGGETNDTAMIDLAVALNCEFVKVGPTRGERVEKYNRLMEIEDELKGSFFLP